MGPKSDMAYAFMTLLLSIAGAALAWVGIHALLRRFLGNRVRILDRVLYFVFAVVFNILVWYFAVIVCTAGMKQFLPNISGGEARFVNFLLELASGIPGVKGMKAYEIIGVMIGTVSLVVTHLLYSAILWVSRWVGYELHGVHAATRADLRNQIGVQEPDLTEAEVIDQATRRTNWVVGWMTLERLASLAAALVLFVWIVLKFDVLLMQIQLAEMMGLAEKVGQTFVRTKDVPSPDQLFREYGTTGAVLVLKGLTYFYMGLLMIAAYLLHVSYHALTSELETTIPGPGRVNVALGETSQAGTDRVTNDEWAEVSDHVGPAAMRDDDPPHPHEAPMPDVAPGSEPIRSTSRVQDD